MTFSPLWFRRFKWLVLILLNLGQWRFPSLGRTGIIIDATPEGVTFWGRQGERTLVTWSRPVVGQWLYRTYGWLWSVAHVWDLWADIHLPVLSFGCDSFGPVYPEAGTSGTTIDGSVPNYAGSVSWSTIRGAASGATPITYTVQPYIECSATTNEFAWLTRGFATFDTSSMGAGATVSAATLSVAAIDWACNYELGNIGLNIVESTQASSNALVAGDFDAVGTTDFGDVAPSGSWAASYLDITLTAAARTYIASKAADISKFAFLNHWDFDNTAPTWSSGKKSKLVLRDADDTGNIPKLTATYTPAGATFVPRITRGAFLGIFNGVGNKTA